MGITDVALNAVSAQAVTAATRGETTFDSTAGYYAKKTPIGCIDKSVRFNDIKVTTGATGTGKEMVYTFCDPSGFKGVSVKTNTLAQNSALYAEAAYTKANRGNVANSWYQVLFSATTTNGPATAAAITTAQAGPISRVWDPILVAQLTQGGMCCDAEYYSANGVGRGTISEVPAISAYDPPLTGGDMSGETSPGDMSPAPSQYSLPTTSSTAATQKANEAKQRKCATHITSMMKMNKAVAKTAAGTQTAPGAFGYDYSAINFPLWK